MSDESLIADLLAKPTSTYAKKSKQPVLTKKVEIAGAEATVTLEGDPDTGVEQGAALDALEARGLKASEWVATSFEGSDRELANGDIMRSNRFKFARVGTRSAQMALAEVEPEIPWDQIDLELAAMPWNPGLAAQLCGPVGYGVGVADAQLGKVDGDGVAGALKRSLEYLDEAREDLDFYRTRYDIGEVLVAFLGDMLEGFVSQGGANAWRTSLTPGEQFRMVRRIMTHALKLFGDSASRVKLVAIPGNHDETIRLNGKGTTKYSDSWDVEALIAVSDHARDISGLERVQFLVPEDDEMTVITELAGTVMGFAHGHQFKPGKHFEWWKGQGFGGSPLIDADVLWVGHLHHELIEADGLRTFLQSPSLESESTWYRHATGTHGNPGLMTGLFQDGRVLQTRVLR